MGGRPDHPLRIARLHLRHWTLRSFLQRIHGSWNGLANEAVRFRSCGYFPRGRHQIVAAAAVARTLPAETDKHDWRGSCRDTGEIRIWDIVYTFALCNKHTHTHTHTHIHTLLNLQMVDEEGDVLMPFHTHTRTHSHTHTHTDRQTDTLTHAHIHTLGMCR